MSETKLTIKFMYSIQRDIKLAIQEMTNILVKGYDFKKNKIK